jgi:hypothetical protein
MSTIVRAMLQRPECEEGHTMGPSPGPEHEIVQGGDEEKDEQVSLTSSGAPSPTLSPAAARRRSR